MQVTGNIVQKGQTEVYGNNGFRKRELVIKTDEQYPQSILIEFVQDKCDLLNNLTIGNNVTVNINLRGREWVNTEGDVKYFNSIQGWRITTNNSQGQQANQSPNDINVNKPQQVTAPPVEGDDDLPF